MRRRNPLKQFSPLIAVIIVIGIVVTVYGLNRSDVKPLEPDSPEADRLVDAQELLEQGQPEQAVQIIDDWQAEARKGRIPEEAAFLRLQALDQAGMHEKLAEQAAIFLNTHKESINATEAELMLLASQVSTAGLTNPTLVESVESFVDQHPDHPGVSKLLLALGEQEKMIGDKAAARRRLAGALEAVGGDSETQLRIHKALGDLNLEALKRGDSGSEALYTVENGDSVWGIAQKHDVTSELLMEVNGIDDPRRLRVGQSLRIPETDFSLVCDITQNVMTLYNKGEFLKTYSVRTGRVPGTTPTGEYRILNKKEKPTWRPGDGRVYLPGDPNNELGTRWMAFEGDILGIHGTIHPETVGHYASNGCIGMTRDDVEELFDLIEVGTPLTIVGEQDASRHKVIESPNVPNPLSRSEIASLHK